MHITYHIYKVLIQAHIYTSIYIHLVCDPWPTLLQFAPRLPTSSPTNTLSHTLPSPPLLWPNLSDLSHPRAFSSVCPSWTLVHLTALQGSFLMAKPELQLSSWGRRPRGSVGGGGGNSAPRQQQSVKSFRFWHEDLRTWVIRTHKHMCHSHQQDW